MTQAHTATPFKGEGEVKVIIQTRVRRECDNCGNPATKRFSYCYLNGRSNPASSMYKQDDCTWCSDAEAFSCDECKSQVERVCCPDGMSWGGTFSVGGNCEHMFLRWDERNATVAELTRPAVVPMLALVKDAQAILAAYLPPDGITKDEAISKLLELLDGPQSRAALKASKEQ